MAVQAGVETLNIDFFFMTSSKIVFFLDTSQKKFIVKEGVKYKLMLTFNIQEESVSGLKFINNKYKKSIVGKCTVHLSRNQM